MRLLGVVWIQQLYSCQRNVIIGTENDTRIRFARALHRGVRDPNFGLPRPIRDGLEPDQKHVIQMHEPLANFPVLRGGFAYGVWSLLWFGREQPQTRNLNTM